MTDPHILSNSSENQSILRKLVEREVIVNVSYLVSDVTSLAACADSNCKSSITYEDMLDMAEVRDTPEQLEQVARENCYEVVEINGEFYWYEDEFDGKVPLKDVPEDYSIKEVKRSKKFSVFYEGELQESLTTREGALCYIWSDFFSKEGKDAFDDEEEAWKDCCEQNNLEPDPYDVYEHWVVSDFFSRKLQAVGEKVVDFGKLDVWCRTCTGQAILLDPCIAEIAEGMEILVGQQYSWAKETVDV